MKKKRETSKEQKIRPTTTKNRSTKKSAAMTRNMRAKINYKTVKKTKP